MYLTTPAKVALIIQFRNWVVKKTVALRMKIEHLATKLSKYMVNSPRYQ